MTSEREGLYSSRRDDHRIYGMPFSWCWFERHGWRAVELRSRTRWLYLNVFVFLNRWRWKPHYSGKKPGWTIRASHPMFSWGPVQIHVGYGYRSRYSWRERGFYFGR